MASERLLAATAGVVASVAELDSATAEERQPVVAELAAVAASASELDSGTAAERQPAPVLRVSPTATAEQVAVAERLQVAA